MGKLILGILAVIALQIAFSIYLAMDRTVDESTVAAFDSVAQKNAGQNQAVDPASRAYSEHSDMTAPDPSAADLTSPTKASRPAARIRTRTLQNGSENRHPRRFDRHGDSSLSKNSYRDHDQTANMVRREYFGGMVLETSFQASKDRGTKFIKGKTRRLIFGNVIVEYKYAA